VAPADEVLVDLVRDGVRDAEPERGQLSAERAEQQRAEHGVLGEVRGLAEHLIPGPEA
jgi:hypothetical protein